MMLCRLWRQRETVVDEGPTALSQQFKSGPTRLTLPNYHSIIHIMSSIASRSSPQPPRRAAIDPLAMAGMNGAQEAEEEDAPAAAARRRGPRRNRVAGDIPPVRDATGEKVMEQFEAFLRG